MDQGFLGKGKHHGFHLKVIKFSHHNKKFRKKNRRKIVSNLPTELERP